MNLQDLLNLLILGVTAVSALATLPSIALQFRRYLTRKVSGEDLRLMRDVVTQVVQSVEQQMKTASSKRKLDAAVELASRTLTGYGVTVDQVQLRSLIESAVFLMNASLALPDPPASDAPAPAPPVTGG